MRLALACLAALTLLLGSPGASRAGTLLDADEVLTSVGFSRADRDSALSGEFVTAKLKSTSSRDLAVAVAFLVRQTPEKIDAELITRGLLLARDPNTMSHGDLTGAGTVAQLGTLDLGNAEKKLYLSARAGAQTNLSSDEITALEALKGNAGEVTAEMRKLLLARYSAYRSKGLGGIAPYARSGSKTTDAGGDLRRASEAARALKIYEPSFYDALLEAHDADAAGVEHAYRWARYDARNQPTLMLIHAFSMHDGNAEVAVQRQYYVSRGYNVEQAIVGIVPVKQGSIVVYTNHTSTDQVAGLGGSAKRSIGERLMVTQLERLFSKLRYAAEHEDGQ